MLIILANRHDTTAQQLAARWQDAQVLTCADMSIRGWRYYVHTPRSSTILVGGREVAQSEISGVLTRLPYIYAAELVSIVPDDRAYVATEMVAFLTCWLASLTCPVLNPPTASSLSGPGWPHEQWIHTAALLGMNVLPVRRQIRHISSTLPSRAEAYPNPISVTVVGKRIIGTVDEHLATQARRLAEAAKVALLTVQFSSPEADACFLQAHVWPDVTRQEIADTIFEYFQDERTR